MCWSLRCLFITFSRMSGGCTYPQPLPCITAARLPVVSCVCLLYAFQLSEGLLLNYPVSAVTSMQKKLPTESLLLSRTASIVIYCKLCIGCTCSAGQNKTGDNTDMKQTRLQSVHRVYAGHAQVCSILVVSSVQVQVLMLPCTAVTS